MGSWWHHYWAWTGGNIGAMPLQAVIAAVAGLLLRKPLKRAWRHAVGDHADVEDIRRMAAAAHRISADLFEHHTGSAHPLAPEITSQQREG
jgi:hypothetical protein